MHKIQALALIDTELEKAKKKHPKWPYDIVHQVSIVTEESGELTKAVNEFVYEGGTYDALVTEAVQTAAMAIRFLENLPDGN